MNDTMRITWLLAAAIVTVAAAQEPMFSPAQGQTPDVMEQDKSYCRSVAESQTASAAPAQQTRASGGGRARGAARGAAVGAAQTERQMDDIPTTQRGSTEAQSARQDAYKEEQMKDAARAGAAAGAAVKRSSRRQQAAAQGQQQAAQQSSFDAAYKSCMMGKGYTAY